MLESIRSPSDGLWRLRFYGVSAGYKQDAYGEVLTFATKAACELARRKFERGSSGFDRPKSDFILPRR